MSQMNERDDEAKSQGVQLSVGSSEYEAAMSDPSVVRSPAGSNALAFPSKWQLQGFIGDASGAVVDLSQIMRIEKRK